MKKLLSIDPGMMSGVVIGQFDDDMPYIRLGWAEVPDGLEGIAGTAMPWDADVVVCERFRARHMARSYRQNELEPLRIEGFVRAMRGDTHFRWPEQRGLGMGGVPAMHQAMKSNGLWLTGEAIPNHKDADDVNAATAHALAWLASQGHEPTLEAYLR